VRYVTVEGVRLSVIGLGTWQFGSTEWGYGRTYAQETAQQITRRALDLGVNLVDTAEVYGLGRSEQILGRALRGVRDQAFVATKLFPAAPLGPVMAWRAGESARRLGVDVIDLYQLHWPNRLVPLAHQMAGLRSLQERGLVRHVGVSNYSQGGWEAAERALGGAVLSNQVSYSLTERAPDRGIVPYAAEHDRLVIAYSPLAQGFLSGRYDADHPPSGATRAANPLFQPENLAAGRDLLGALADVARRHDATSSQVALAWVVRRPNVVAIPGASTVAQLEANAAAADLVLSDDDDALLTDASDRFHPRRDPFGPLRRVGRLGQSLGARLRR
jgi:aryl-alcohol dehydrogenase-like predicted oxidoreductase